MQRFFRRFTDRPARHSIKRAINRVLESLESRTLMSVTLDGNGYTKITPSDDTKTIFVSSTQGNDGNSGLSESSPVHSIGKGMSLLRSGSPDWLVLKKGDAWSEAISWSKNGRSEDEPMVFGSYGSGDRPLIKAGSNDAFYSGGMQNVAVMGLHFMASTRNPDSSDFNGNAAGGFGIEIVGPAKNVLIEDTQVEFFRDNVAIMAWNGSPTNIKLRKNVINNSWSTSAVSTGGKSQGVFVSGVTGITMDGNVFDHNGWNERINGAQATLYGHNVYVWTDNTGVVFKKNISSNAGSHGLQARSGGIIDNNLFLDDPIGLTFGKGSPVTPGGVSGEVKDNVFVGDHDISGATRGWAIEVGNTKKGGGTVFSGNIITNDEQNAFAAIRLMTLGGIENPNEAAGLNDLTIENNIIHGWHQALDYSWDFVPGGTGPSALNNLTVRNNDFTANGASPQVVAHNSTFNGGQENWSGNNYSNPQSPSAWITVGGSNTSMDVWRATVDKTATMGPKQYYESDRTIAAYNGSLNREGSEARFIETARAMSKDHYIPAWTAPEAIAYIQEGFGRGNGTPTPVIPSTGSTGSTDTGPFGSVPQTPVSTMPQARVVSAPTVTTSGLTQLIQVTYSDDGNILYGSLDSGDLWISGPNGYGTNAKFLYADAKANGSPRTATYAVTAPGGNWDAGDNGAYTISMSKYAVYDMSGNDVAEGPIGSFDAALTNTEGSSTGSAGGGILNSVPTPSLLPIPQARLVSAPTVKVDSAAETITVTYTDDQSIYYPSLDSNDLSITGPNGYSANARFLYADGTFNGSPRTVTYSVSAPGGSWDAGDNGTYNVSVSKYAVYDTTGNDVPQGSIGSFAVALTSSNSGFLDSIPTSTGSSMPQARLISAPTVNLNGATELLSVTYTDDQSILYASLDSADIWISGPNGFGTNGKFVRADATTNGSPRTVTYAVVAPGGNWDRSDNGVYTVSMSKYAVYDMSGNDVAARTIGSFTAAMV